MIRSQYFIFLICRQGLLARDMHVKAQINAVHAGANS